MSWTQLQRSYLQQYQLPHEGIGALGPTLGLDELPRSAPDEHKGNDHPIEHPLVRRAHARAQRQGTGASRGSGRPTQVPAPP